MSTRIKCCDNENPLSIPSGRGVGDGQTHREEITVCHGCGQFRVFAEVNGQQTTITFYVWGEEHLRAALRAHERAFGNHLKLVDSGDGIFDADGKLKGSQYNSVCCHCGQPFNGTKDNSTLCGPCFVAGHRSWYCGEQCKTHRASASSGDAVATPNS